MATATIHQKVHSATAKEYLEMQKPRLFRLAFLVPASELGDKLIALEDAGIENLEKMEVVYNVPFNKNKPRIHKKRKKGAKLDYAIQNERRKRNTTSVLAELGDKKVTREELKDLYKKHFKLNAGSGFHPWQRGQLKQGVLKIQHGKYSQTLPGE